MQARLPEPLEDRDQIKNLPPNVVHYTLPWAVWADTQGRMWINPEYPIGKERAGTLDLMIERTRHGIEIYPDASHRWSREESGWLNSIPVAKVHTECGQ